MSDHKVYRRTPGTAFDFRHVPPGTCFVLEQDDPAAYAALWAYASALNLIVETNPHLSPDARRAYVEQAAQVEELASAWQAARRRDD